MANSRHFDMPDEVGLDLLRAIVRMGKVIGIRVAHDGNVYLHPLGDTYFDNVANGQHVATLTDEERSEFLRWCRAQAEIAAEPANQKRRTLRRWKESHTKLWEMLRVDIELAPIL